MATRAQGGKRWLQVLELLTAELPGTWAVRGGGLKSIATREPIGWAIPWIGCSKASSVRLHAGVAPTVWHQLKWAMGEFGIDQSELVDAPTSIELGADDDLDVARSFVQLALRRFDELTPDHYANDAEFWLNQLSISPRTPAISILMAPGWRVVNENADPVAAIDGCFEYLSRRWPNGSEATPAITEFLNGLAASWSDGRGAALAYLVERRDRQLTEQGYDNPH